MEYLTIMDLQEQNTIDFKEEKLLLIEPAGEGITYIDEAEDDRNNGEYINADAKVFIRQRWKVDVLPPDNFSKTFTTHRYISVYYCSYGQLLEEQERIYTAWEVLPNNPSDGNELGDNFNSIF